MTKVKYYVVATLALAFTAAATASVLVDGGGLGLTWSTIDCGGGAIGSGDLRLNATIGQHDASGMVSAGDLSLSGGFWPGGPAAAGFEVATLMGFRIVEGTLLSGGLPELEASDDAYVRAASGIGASLLDLHNIELRINAETLINEPRSIDLLVESHISEPVGIVQVGILNWSTHRYDLVGRDAVGMDDAVSRFSGLDASDYVSSHGEIALSAKVIVFTPFRDWSFQSSVDFIRISVRE